MSGAFLIVNGAVLIPLTAFIAYYDIRYRRIPNAIVLGTLVGGLTSGAIYGGWGGFANRLSGCLMAFTLMLVLHLVSGLGAGDVKLFGAIGALLGVNAVFPALLIIVLMGGVLAMIVVIRARAVQHTLVGVYNIFVGLACGQWWVRRIELMQSGLTIPYGIAISCGSLIAVAGGFLRT